MENWNEATTKRDINKNKHNETDAYFEFENKEKNDLEKKLKNLYPNDAHFSGIDFQYLKDNDWKLLKNFLNLIEKIENGAEKPELIQKNMEKIEEQRLEVKKNLEKIREYKVINEDKITGNYYIFEADKYSKEENEYFSRGNFLGLITNKIWSLDYELTEKYPGKYKSIYNG